MARTPGPTGARRKRTTPAAPADTARSSAGPAEAGHPDNVEEASIESMVASDPPSFTGTTSGSPDHIPSAAAFPEPPEGVSAEDEATITRIRERAYDLWVEAGRPDGREMEFWLAAEREMGKR